MFINSNQTIFEVVVEGDEMTMTSLDGNEKHTLVKYYDKRYKKWGWIRKNWVKK